MKDRIAWIDSMRGLAMAFVVTNHVLYMNLFENITDSLLNPIIVFCELPIFFFVSGILSKTLYADRETNNKIIISRLKCLLVPFVVCGTIFSIVFGQNLLGLYFGHSNNGYWFLPVLFLFECLLFIKRNICCKIKQNLIFYATTLIGWLALAKFYKYVPVPIAHALNIEQIVLYLPYYFFGCMLKEFFCVNRFNTFPYFAISAIMFTITYFVKFPLYNIIGTTCIVIMLIFFISRVNIKALNYIGKNTLAIYCFHYFAIYLFRYFGIKDVAHYSSVLFDFLSLPLSFFIIYFCIVAKKVIEKTKLSKYVWGTF